MLVSRGSVPIEKMQVRNCVEYLVSAVKESTREHNDPATFWRVLESETHQNLAALKTELKLLEASNTLMNFDDIKAHQQFLENAVIKNYKPQQEKLKPNIQRALKYCNDQLQWHITQRSLEAGGLI